MQTPTVPHPGIATAADRNATARFATGVHRASRSLAGASDAVWVPMASGALVLAVGAMSLATRQPWLFPALGATAVLVATNPGHPTTRFHAIVLGHVSAFACAWLA